MRILFKYILLQIFLFGTTTLVAQDIPQSEKDALRALYDATNGDAWTNTVQNKGKWDFSTPVTSWNATTQTGWWGIQVSNGKVQQINLDNNNLTGTIPNAIGNFQTLILLGLNNNKLIGSIPDSICNLSKLSTLSINFTNLTGSIPQNIGQLENLTFLDLVFNKLEGEIPKSIGNLKKLVALRINNNNLTGSIPLELSNLILLRNLQIANNKLTGIIPAQIGSLTDLIQLSFGYNQLTGNIPNEIANLKKLQYLNLNNNALSGTIPSNIGSLTSLLSLNFSTNNLNNPIPNSLGNLVNLTSLVLNNNNLNGNIPNEIRNLTKLKSLTLNNNQLTGKIPDLTGIALTSLNFTNNKFRFIDFINEFPTYKTSLNSNFVYSPQAKTDSPKTMLRHAGQSATMEMFEDLRFNSGDTYQWFKNGVAIVGQTNRTLTLSNVTTASTGTYMCRAYHSSNPDMSPLVLEREPITLTVDNAIFTCTNFSSSFTTTGVDGQPYRCGTIKVIPQLQNTDKIAEIRWSITNPDRQRTFLSNQIIPNIEISQYGVYQISAFIVDKEGCEMYTGYGFEVIDCAVCDVTIPGEIVLSDTYSCGTRYPNLSFSNPNNISLSYQWKFYKPDGSLWYTDNMPTPVTNFDLNGNYKVELIIKNNLYNCQTRTLMVTIPVIACKNTCPIPGEIQMTDCGFGERKTSKEEGCNYTCGERTTYFHLSSEQTIYENSTYNWVFKNPNGQVIGTSNSADYQVPFTFTAVGNNKVELTITNADGCPTVFTPIVVPVVSCCTPVIGEIKVYNNAHLRTTKSSAN